MEEMSDAGVMWVVGWSPWLPRLPLAAKRVEVDRPLNYALIRGQSKAEADSLVLFLDFDCE